MQAVHLFLLHVFFFAATPVVLAVRRSPLTTPLLYAYLAVTLVIGGFLSAVYRFPLTGDVVVGAGSVAHAAFLFTSLVLLVTTRDVIAIRDVIKLALLTTAFKVAFIVLVTRSLRSGEVIAPFDADPGLFDASMDVILAGSGLIIAELVSMVFVIERIKSAPRNSTNPVWYPIVFAGVLLLDGLLFPILSDPLAADLPALVRASVLGKLIVAAAFCLPVLLYMAIFRDRMELFEAEPLQMRGLLRGPNVELVREIERQDRELKYQATHDDLTGLLNRSEILRCIDEHLGRSGVTRRRPLAVMFIDLDDFKLVNDAHGHAAGDTTLITVAERIRSCLRDGDAAARLGGDEFIALITDLPDEETALHIGERIIDRLTEPVWISADTTVSVHASIGLAYAGTGSAQSGEVLVRNADLAMYRAKDLGKDRLERYSEDLHRRALARAELVTEIHAGLEEGEFVAFYQPQVELTSGRVLGVEALARWHHPRRGLLTPTAFISEAESSAAILHLGQQVLLQACTDAMRWRDRGAPPVEVSVNVSARQLRDPDLVAQVTEALGRTGMEPDLLTIEITESSLISDVHRSVRAVEQLRDLGIKVSIDDFGTGFSSLAYLHMLPVDALKIDKSFVDRICDTEIASGGPLVASIIGLGKLLDLTVVAEGVERIEQCNALVDLGCDLGQGFHFAPAMDADAIAELLEGDRLDACLPA
jgi:diguanylate cyclase (GGDEF)-like protein